MVLRASRRRRCERMERTVETAEEKRCCSSNPGKEGGLGSLCALNRRTERDRGVAGHDRKAATHRSNRECVLRVWSSAPVLVRSEHLEQKQRKRSVRASAWPLLPCHTRICVSRTPSQKKRKERTAICQKVSHTQKSVIESHSLKLSRSCR